MPSIHDMIESKYLKKEDAGEDGTVVTVDAISNENVAPKGQEPENKWVMQFREFEKPMVLNSTNIKLAAKALGSDNTDDWIGKKLIVYNDPNISFAGELKGGIRIKAYRRPAPPREITQPSKAQVDRDFAEPRDNDIPF